MVKIRPRDSEFVQLHVQGSKLIVRNPFTALARLDATWIAFLTGCGLKLSELQGVSVRSHKSKEQTKANGKTKGWTADLNGTIRAFIAKYERKKQLHAVYLVFNDTADERLQGNFKGRKCMPPNLSPISRSLGTAGPSIVIGTGPSTKRHVSFASDVNGYKKPRYTPGYSLGPPEALGKPVRYGTRLRSLMTNQDVAANNVSTNIKTGLRNRQQVQRRLPTSTRRTGKFRNGEPATPQIADVRSLIKMELEPEPTVIPFNGGDYRDDDEEEETSNTSAENDNSSDNAWHGHADDDDDDNLSMCTTLTAQDAELRRDGIQVEDVKSLVTRRFSRFSNAFMLRVRTEMRKLKNNNLWDRNVNRSPLACYLLQEILKD